MQYELNLMDEATNEAIKLITLIPADARCLQFREGSLHNKEADVLITLFSHIPSTITTVDLSGHDLLEKKFDELLQALPQQVHTLILNGNGYGYDESRLALVFACIPRHISTLVLGDNALHLLSDGQWNDAFAYLPETLTGLCLNNNGLGQLSTPRLIAFFRAIPEQVKVLDLSYNSFHQKKAEELSQLLKAIPLSIKTIKLNYNSLFVGKNRQEKDDILCAIPADEYGNKHRFVLKGNGEADISRAIVPMASFFRAGRSQLPRELIIYVLSFLLEKNQRASVASLDSLFERVLYNRA